MKLTYKMIEDAQVLLEKGLHKQLKINETYVGALTYSLEVYQRRGEYDGSFNTALNCLELAGYEFYRTDLK